MTLSFFPGTLGAAAASSHTWSGRLLRSLGRRGRVCLTLPGLLISRLCQERIANFPLQEVWRGLPKCLEEHRRPPGASQGEGIEGILGRACPLHWTCSILSALQVFFWAFLVFKSEELIYYIPVSLLGSQTPRLSAAQHSNRIVFIGVQINLQKQQPTW